MSNVVPFPLASAGAGRLRDHLGGRLLERPPPHAHAVQFYDDDAFLIETVASFLEAGFLAGEAAVVIATPTHTHALSNKLGAGRVQSAQDCGGLMFVDAETMLGRFMQGDAVSESLFMEALGRILESFACGVAPQRRVRAFGEMVDVLWRQGKQDAAMQLEELWNRAGTHHDFVLLCGYSMGNFYRHDDIPHFRNICRLHTHAMPTEAFVRQDGDEFERLRQISLLEQRARLLQNEVQYREEVEHALRETLGERLRVEHELREIIEREREGRVFSRAEALLRLVRERLKARLDSCSSSASEIQRGLASFAASALRSARSRLPLLNRQGAKASISTR